MPRAHVISYHAVVTSLRELAETTGIHYTTLRRWHAAGKLSDDRIDAFMLRRHLRETAVRNGVSLHAARVRRWRGWPVELSYRAQQYARLKSMEGTSQ